VGNSGVDSDSDPEKSGPAVSAAAPVAPVAPAAYTEVQPEALVERTEAVGDGDSMGIIGMFFCGFPMVSRSIPKIFIILLKLRTFAGNGCWNGC